MVPVGSGSFDGTANERGMRARRSDSSAGQGDNRKQYELDVDKIMRGDDSRTTLMIKNIPNKYVGYIRVMTLQLLSICNVCDAYISFSLCLALQVYIEDALGCD